MSRLRLPILDSTGRPSGFRFIDQGEVRARSTGFVAGASSYGFLPLTGAFVVGTSERDMANASQRAYMARKRAS